MGDEGKLCQLLLLRFPGFWALGLHASGGGVRGLRVREVGLNCRG